MPSISLVPTRAAVGISRGEDLISAGDRTVLVFAVKPEEPWRNEVRLTTGEKFQDLEGNVRLHPGEPPPEWEKIKVKRTALSREDDTPVIGTLTYSEETDIDFTTYPASYDAEVWIGPSYFDQLLRAARQGKMPSSIRVDVAGDGIKYGWEPDGSGKDWDNKAKPQLAVIRISVNLPLAGTPADAEEEKGAGVPALDELPPTRAQINQLLKLLEGTHVRVGQLVTILFWSAVVVVVVLLFLRR